MRKPESLRRLLEANVPGLAANPAQLDMHVDAGRVAAREGRTLSFTYRYKLTIVVQDYAGEIDAITIPILAWISENEPQLLRGEEEPFSFEAEILSATTADIEIQLELAENVRVLPGDGGGYAVEHLPEPADRDRFDGVDQNLWRIFLNEELVAETTDPAAFA